MANMKTLHRIYNGEGWVLGICQECGRANFVEPHGTTAACPKCHKDTEHKNIPYTYRNLSGNYAYLNSRADNRYMFAGEQEGK